MQAPATHRPTDPDVYGLAVKHGRRVEREQSMTAYHFPCELARPVTFWDDPDCQDTLGVPVIVYCTLNRDGEPTFLRAEVTRDVRNDDGHLVRERGEVIEHYSFTEADREKMDETFAKNRRWDAADERQEFPNYEAGEIVEFDFDQRFDADPSRIVGLPAEEMPHAA